MMALGPYLLWKISSLEDEARRREGHANALESDALAERRAAENCRKTAEWLRKSDALQTAGHQTK